MNTYDYIQKLQERKIQLLDEKIRHDLLGEEYPLAFILEIGSIWRELDILTGRKELEWTGFTYQSKSLIIHRDYGDENDYRNKN